MIRVPSAVVALASALLLVAVPACGDSKPRDKIATQMVTPVGPPVGAGGAVKPGSRSKIPADNAKVE